MATLGSRHSLAATLASEQVHRYDEAEALYLETIEARKRVLGDDHSDTLLSMNGLAVLYTLQGRYDEAEDRFLEMLGSQHPGPGESDPAAARTLYNLACLQALRGDRAKALGRLRQSVEAGWHDADSMAKDLDLEFLRDHPEFKRLVAEVKMRLATEE